MALSPLSTWSWSEYSVPISERKRPVDWPRTIGFSVLFNVVIFSAHGLLWTLIVLYPFAATRPYYERGVQYFKNLFGRLIVVISQFFAPTKLVISCSDEQGNIVDPEKLVQRDSKGRIVHVNLPDKSVWMSNHQVGAVGAGAKGTKGRGQTSCTLLTRAPQCVSLTRYTQTGSISGIYRISADCPTPSSSSSSSCTSGFQSLAW